MACTKDFIDFLCEQISPVGVVEAKKMFGDYTVYVDGKPLILACDNVVYVRKLPAIAPLMQNAECGFPYKGAKERYILDVGHRDEAVAVLKALLEVTPYPEKKAGKNRIKRTNA